MTVFARVPVLLGLVLAAALCAPLAVAADSDLVVAEQLDQTWTGI